MGDLGWVADRIAIQDVLVRYCRGIDRRDVDTIRSVYWPDSYDDHGGFKGNGHAFAERVVPALDAQFDATHHSILNSSVDLDGDVAHTETYVHAYHVMKSPPGAPKRVFLYAGRYIDRLEKRGGAWRIAHRVCVYDFDRIDPIADAQSEAWTSTFQHGTRDAHDPSFTRA